jgi:hypothetical protein
MTLLYRPTSKLPRPRSVGAKLRYAIAVATLIFLASLQRTPRALAITAEVAKKCAELSGKAYPPRVLGNPAAGYINGTTEDYRKYFNKCVANGGTIDDPSASPANHAPPNNDNEGLGSAPK